MSISTPDVGKFIGTSELARLLERSEAAIRAAEKDGRLPRAARAGNRRVWSREEIEDFIATTARSGGGDQS